MKRSLSVILAIWISVACPLGGLAGINIESPAWRKVEALGKANTYVFLFFRDSSQEESQRVRTTLDEVRQELVDKKYPKADVVEIMPDDSNENRLIEFFKITERPTLLVIAPNGAVTGYFRKTVDKKALSESLVSLKEAEVVKTLQEGRAVFLCFHKDKEPNLEAIKTDLQSVANNFRGVVNVIYANSDDKKEEKLMKKLKMSSPATTAFIIVPPGRAVAKLEGPDITKANLMRALMSSCGSGCGSGCR